MAKHQHPQGWHPDPWRQAQYRWWDGYQWTQHTQGDIKPPPPPGTPTEAPAATATNSDTRKPLWGIALVAFGGLALAFGGLVLVAVIIGGGPGAGGLDLAIIIGPSGLALQSDQYLTDCRLDLDPGGHTTRVPELNEGTPRQIPWSRFTDSNSTRFDYGRTAPEKVTIRCVDAGGVTLTSTWRF